MYLETHITESCNLKCRGCSHFSGLAKPKHKDLEKFRQEFARLAEILSLSTIRLMGGEPLLNPRFMEYLRIARKFYPYAKLVLVTNGILSDRLRPHVQELRELRVDVTVSDYHIDSQDLSILSKLPYTERHEKGRLYNISLDPTGSQDKDAAFSKCDLHQNHWNFFQDGRIYPCCIAGTIQDFWDHFGLNWGIDQKSLGIDIFTAGAAEIQAFLNKPNELCCYCATEIRQHSYRPFERSKGDIREWTV